MTTTEQADALRLQRVVDLIDARVDDPASRLNMLDLASRTGVFSEGLAMLGHDVLGVEGRQANIDQVATPRMARYLCDDVRNVPTFCEEDEFDVTLCLGLLYHLTLEEALNLLDELHAVTSGFVILDTHVSLAPTAEEKYDGRTYRGHWYSEGAADTPWSSIGNLQSFWFTPESLGMAILRAGFRRVEPIDGPAYPGEPADRRWYVLHKRGGRR